MACRIGVIGLGMGKAHCLAALRGRGAQLTAIAEPNVGRREQFTNIINEKHPELAAAFAKVRFFDDYRAMAKSGAVDAVVAALPTHMHCQGSIDLLKAGVHVLCEKPPTVDVKEMKRVAKVVEDTGLTYMFVRQQRFEPAKFAAREMIAKGRLGDICHAESKWLRTRGIPFRGGWGVNKDTGGGVLLDLGIHKLDDAWFVMGNPVPATVFCNMHCAYHAFGDNQKLSMPYNADDVTFGTVRFADGASLDMGVTFALTTAGPDDHPLTEEEGSAGNRDWQELKIYGSKAGLDIPRRRLVKPTKDGMAVSDLKISKTLEKMSTGMVGQIENFVTSIRKGTEPMNNVTQAMQLMQMLEAMKKSAQTGKSVDITPF